MAKTLSQDLRSRLITAVESGLSRRAAARRFEVGVATAIRWVREYRTTGATTAKRKGGDRRSHRIEAFHTIIDQAIKAQVDITLVELAEMLHRHHGVSFAPSTIWRFLDRHDITFKKNRARQRAGAARRRRAASGMVGDAAISRSEAPGFHR
jgi:transposase